MLRAAPPGAGCASKTSTCNPAWANTMAAARPFGPDPTTHALEFLTTIFGLSGSHSWNEYSLTPSVAHRAIPRLLFRLPAFFRASTHIVRAVADATTFRFDVFLRWK